MGNSFRVTFGVMCLLLSCLKPLSDSDPFRPWACYFSLCNFMWALIFCIYKVFYLGCPPCPLALIFFLYLFEQCSLNPWGSDLMKHLSLSSIFVNSQNYSNRLSLSWTITILFLIPQNLHSSANSVSVWKQGISKIKNTLYQDPKDWIDK